ncbi:MAG: alanine--glyoxylate aminotransferase family protein [Flavobacteriaceae bacterium]|nr:alanine--glyoxylate aminotransferase family protein [Flavobacteriaceae bacterium]
MKNRKLLMIPGPIEFEPEVLRAMGEQTTSHVAPNFIKSFGKSLSLVQDIWKAPNGQAFIVAGSGTLAMEMAVANIIDVGENALVINTGYFGDRYKDILETFGAQVTMLEAPFGETIALESIEKELKTKKYKLLTMTHVDTSTGVLTDPKPIADLCNRYKVLSVLDGVCSVAGEYIHQEEWKLDIVLTGSQKAIGVPPGLALLVASQKAIQAWMDKKFNGRNYYSSWKEWLPIMQAYAEGNPSYFATPAVNLIRALEVSLNQINKEGVDVRIERQHVLARAFKKALESIHLKWVPKNDKITAHTLSAIYYPEGLDIPKFHKKMKESGVIIAGGLHPRYAATYFRVGHMGAITASDLFATLGALEQALHHGNHTFNLGLALKTFQNELK